MINRAILRACHTRQWGQGAFELLGVTNKSILPWCAEDSVWLSGFLHFLVGNYAISSCHYLLTGFRILWLNIEDVRNCVDVGSDLLRRWRELVDVDQNRGQRCRQPIKELVHGVSKLYERKLINIDSS